MSFSAQESQKICCGDTKHCGECMHHSPNGEAASEQIKSFVMNALGRCDFYNGPNKVIFDTSIR